MSWRGLLTDWRGLHLLYTNMQFGLEVVTIDSEWANAMISSRLHAYFGELVIGLYLSEDHTELVCAAKSNRAVEQADAFVSLGSADIVSLQGGAIEGVFHGAGAREVVIRFADGDMIALTPNNPIRNMTCAFLAAFVRRQQVVQQKRAVQQDELQASMQQRSVSLEDDSKCTIS